jgi:hypothetical protein
MCWRGGEHLLGRWCVYRGRGRGRRRLRLSGRALGVAALGLNGIPILVLPSIDRGGSNAEGLGCLIAWDARGAELMKALARCEFGHVNLVCVRWGIVR